MGNRYSSITGTEIIYSLWLTFDERGGVSMQRGEPTTVRGERAVKLNVTLPRSLFRTPELKATLKVPQVVAQDFNLDVSLASEALKTALGIDVDMRVV